MTGNAAHQCHKDSCTSPATNEVHLHLKCPAPGMAARLISMKCSIEVCDDHKDDVRGYVLSDINRETITATLMDQGLHEPDFLSAVFEFKPITPAALRVVDGGVVVDPNCTVDVTIGTEAVPIGCDRLDDGESCANPARWRVVQRFRSLAQGGKGEPVCEVLTNLNVCTKHKKVIKPEDFLDPESRATTLALLRDRGMLLPDVDHPIIAFEELIGGEPEANQIKRAI